MLVRNATTNKLREMPVYLHQRGVEPVVLKRDSVVDVFQAENCALVMHARKSRMASEGWARNLSCSTWKQLCMLLKRTFDRLRISA